MMLEERIKKRKKFKTQKIGELFDKELREIQFKRMVGVDKLFNHPVSRARLTDVIFKDIELCAIWNNVFKKKLETFPRGKDNE